MLQENLDSTRAMQVEAAAQLEQIDSRIEDLKQEKSKHMSGEIKQLEQEAVTLSKELVKKDSELANAHETRTTEANSKKALVAQKEELASSIQSQCPKAHEGTVQRR